MLYGNYDLDMINANQSKHLIIFSSCRLNIFKFIFNYIYMTNDVNNDILEKFNQFQTDFWIEKHWYIEYELSYYSSSIYTVPYTLNSFKLEISTQRYWNQFVNTFLNVTNLTLYHATLKEKTCQYYFPNVVSLTILPPKDTHRPALGTRIIKSLRNIINPF
ncbi:unnamed protein product [Rotaria sp. Silwood2]|nr:unnamed protein product [Rotaria sp. Silwood2]CAF4656935.1 unnamed protein product [Rotaria sp. Silwood2]